MKEMIGGPKHEEHGMLKINKVLCPIAGTDESKIVLDVALDIAQRHQASLTVLNVAPLSTIDLMRDRGHLVGGEDLLSRQVEERLDRHSADVLAGARAHLGENPADYDRIVGHPGQVICEVAGSGQFDLVVIGQRSSQPVVEEGEEEILLDKAYRRHGDRYADGGSSSPSPARGPRASSTPLAISYGSIFGATNLQHVESIVRSRFSAPMARRCPAMSAKVASQFSRVASVAVLLLSPLLVEFVNHEHLWLAPVYVESLMA